MMTRRERELAARRLDALVAMRDAAVRRIARGDYEHFTPAQDRYEALQWAVVALERELAADAAAEA